jgi:phosphoribosyl 1,2-cyclic phosphodiesterase
VSYFYPTPTSTPRSNESAKQWLLNLRTVSGLKRTVATHASPDITPEITQRIAEAIQKKKSAEAKNGK